MMSLVVLLVVVWALLSFPVALMVCRWLRRQDEER
jgi:hypothetical protein